MPFIIPKAIDYSEATSNTYHKAVQTFNLGKYIMI
jgi:hypothetical protein